MKSYKFTINDKINNSSKCVEEYYLEAALSWLLIECYDVTLDKETLNYYMNEFRIDIESEFNENTKGVLKFSNLIEGELLYAYLYKKFGKYPTLEEDYKIKKYQFKSNGQNSDDSTHIIEVGYSNYLDVGLLTKLVHRHNLRIDKNTYNTYRESFYCFIEDEYQLNQKNEHIISHFYSIDMSAELLICFLENKLGLIVDATNL